MAEQELKTIEDLRELSRKADDLAVSGDKDGCRALLGKGLEAAEHISEAYVLFFQAELLFYDEQYGEAIDLLEKALALNEQDFFLLRTKGVRLARLRRYDDAIVEYDKALAINPEDSNSYKYKGVSLCALGRDEAAIEEYDKALTVNSKDISSLKNRGVCLTRLGRNEEAISEYDKALAINGDDFHSYREKGVSLFKLGREEEAIVEFDKALAINGNDYLSFQQKGVSLSKLGREEEAISQYDKALAINGDDFNSFRQKGVSLSNLGRYEEAIAEYDKALAINGEDFNSFRNKGVSLSYLGREEEALAEFDKALAINGDDFNSFRNKGVSLTNLGRYEEALEEFDKALAINGDDFNSFRQKGVSLSYLGRYEEAIVEYDKALAINGDDFNSFRNKGVSLSHLGREEEAISEYDKALAINGDDFNSLRQKGVSLSRLGRYEEAIAEYDKALAINGDDFNSFQQKGGSLSRLGRGEEALVEFDKALAGIRNDYFYYQQKGVTLSMLGRYEEAIVEFDKALAINGEDYDSLCQKGVSLTGLGRDEEAIDEYNKALAINGENYLSYNQKGLSLFNLGRFEEAQKSLEQALEKNPDDDQSRMDLEYVVAFIAANAPDEAETEGADTEGAGAPATASTEKESPSLPVGDAGRGGVGVSSLRAMVHAVREEFKDDIGTFQAEMDNSNKDFAKYIEADGKLDSSRSLFFILRKWNSYTPILSGADGADGEDSVGGGYFLFHKGAGVVVDPGFSFIGNFHRAGLRIADMTHIVITHAHNDHTIDFESLLTLLFKRNDPIMKRNKRKPKDEQEPLHKVTVYFSPSALVKLGGLTSGSTAEYVETVPVSPGQTHDLGSGLSMRVLPAYHRDTIARDYAIGVRFDVATSEGKRRVVLTSDTSLFPTPVGSETVNAKGLEIWKRYGLGGDEKEVMSPDLLIPHIGSVRPEEFEASIDTDYDKIFYPNHLGVMGTLRVITGLHPGLAVVSEFGEELKSFRSKLMKLLAKATKKYCEHSDLKPINVLPGDLPFVYDIPSCQVYCVLSEEFRPAKDIDSFQESFNGLEDTFFYYGRDIGEGTGAKEMRKAAEKFLADCAEGSVKYFKKDDDD